MVPSTVFPGLTKAINLFLPKYFPTYNAAVSPAKARTKTNNTHNSPADIFRKNMKWDIKKGMYMIPNITLATVKISKVDSLTDQRNKMKTDIIQKASTAITI